MARAKPSSPIDDLLIIEQLYATSPIGLCLVDSNLRFVRLNERLAAIDGQSVEAHLGRTLREVVPDIADQITPLYEEVLATGKPKLDIEIRGRLPSDPDNEHTWLVSYHPLHDQHGKVRGVSSAIQDVTILKTIQSQLRMERDLARQYLDVAGVILVALDVRGRITMINRKGCKILGYSESELANVDWFDRCLPPDQSAVVGKVFGEIIAGNIEIAASFENEIMTRTGERRLIAWHNSLLRDFDGQVVGSLSSGEDITEQRQADQRLRDAKNELEERVAQRTATLQAANQKIAETLAEQQRVEKRLRALEAQLAHAGRVSAMGEMAAELAHELNQPLTAIENYAEGAMRRLSGGQANPADIAAALEMVSRQAQRAADVIRRIRQFTRRRLPESAPVNLATCIADVRALLAVETGSRAIEIRVSIAESLPHVVGDPVEFQQVLLNLIHNSVEALRPDDCRVITLEVTRAEHCARVNITDHGAGIPPTIRQDIFTAFFTTKTDGLGMGLSICKSIVERHHGRIWVDDVPTGARISFTLPFEERSS